MNELSQKIESLRAKFADGWSNYIEVDEGWYQIVLDCDAELTALDPDYSILQIKEKFGGLRYYTMLSDQANGDPELRDKIDAVITKYENLALQTCEATGRPGVMMRSVGGWCKTLNPEYAAGTLHYAKYSVLESDADTGDGSGR